MAKIMYSQKWHNINQYAPDYFELLYQYYAAAANRTPITYYNLDLPNSVYDGELLADGAYEMTGEHSGLRWKKFLMLYVYNIEQVNLTLNADENGVGFSDQTTTLFIPTIYEFRPKVHDFISYDQIAWRSDPYEASLPLWEVINLEKASHANITFWKLTLQSSYKIKSDLDEHLSGFYTFVDYEKHIYQTSDAIYLSELQLKNSRLDINNFYKQHIGLYVH